MRPSFVACVALLLLVISIDAQDGGSSSNAGSSEVVTTQIECLAADEREGDCGVTCNCADEATCTTLPTAGECKWSGDTCQRILDPQACIRTTASPGADCVSIDIRSPTSWCQVNCYDGAGQLAPACDPASGSAHQTCCCGQDCQASDTCLISDTTTCTKSGCGNCCNQCPTEQACTNGGPKESMGCGWSNGECKAKATGEVCVTTGVSSEPPTTDPCEVQSGCDYGGNDIPGVVKQVENAAACCAYCQTIPECGSWTWVQADGNCMPKYNKPEKLTSDVYWCGVRGTATCGDGIIQPGEQCDPPSVCCSNQCRFLDSTNMCRPATGGECDLPDYCSGHHGACGHNRKRPNGYYCMTTDDQHGSCLFGKCVVGKHVPSSPSSSSSSAQAAARVRGAN